MKTVTVMGASMFPSRHCERSEAIQLCCSKKAGLLRRCAPRNDDLGEHIPLPDINASAIIEL
jgi:hypothetical protein